MPFHYKPLDKWLVDEWSNNGYKGSFITDAEEKMNADGERLYNKPEWAESWNYHQKEVRDATGDDRACIACIQLYSDKTKLTDKNLSAHPIRATLMNIRPSVRNTSVEKQTVAYFPTLKKPMSGKAKKFWRLVKLAYVAKALDFLLGPLKVLLARYCISVCSTSSHRPESNAEHFVLQRLSFTGVKLPDPDGDERNVYPRLYSYVMDDPEGRDVLGVMQPPSGHPCEACMVPFLELGGVEDVQYPMRSEQTMEEVYPMIKDAKTQSAADAVSREHSVPQVRSGLFGFCGQDAEGPGNIMLVMGYDAMHNEDLGVFRQIIDSMEGYMVHKRIPKRKDIFEEMNKRMSEMPHAGK